MNDHQPNPTTTDAGIPVASDEHSLTIGPDGPLLLQDHYLAGHLRNGVTEQVLDRAFEYWKNIDKETGQRIETAVRNGSS
jgi:catalase